MFKETSLVYIRNKENEKIGAIAIGITQEGRFKITGSAKSVTDKNIPKRHASIALNRLNNAFPKYTKEGQLRKGQTRYLDLTIEEAKRIRFENVIRELGLYKNNNITNWKENGWWTQFIIPTKPMTEKLRDQARHLAYVLESEAVEEDEKILEMKERRERLRQEQSVLKQEIKNRKTELKKKSKKMALLSFF